MYQIRYEDYLPLDNDIDSTSQADTDSIFDLSGDEGDSASNTDIDQSLEEVDNDADNGDDLFNSKVRHPPKYYLVSGLSK